MLSWPNDTCQKLGRTVTTVAWILEEWPAWPVPSLARGITSPSPHHSSPHCAHLPSLPECCLSSPNCLWHAWQITWPQLFISTILGVLFSVLLHTGHMYLNLSCSTSLGFTVKCTSINSFSESTWLPSGHVVTFEGFLIVSLTPCGATEGCRNNLVSINVVASINGREFSLNGRECQIKSVDLPPSSLRVSSSLRLWPL